MIHFDFIVSDEEADTIFDCIREKITRLKDELAFEIASNKNHWHHTKWFNNHIAFLENIIEKMKNKRK